MAASPSSSLYGRWDSLSALLDAAGVPVSELDHHTTAELVARAEARSGPTRMKAPKRAPDVPFDERPAYTIRSIRLLVSLERAVDKKARAHGSTLNAVVCRLLQEYVDGHS